jgi:hypothetical protein
MTKVVPFPEFHQQRWPAPANIVNIGGFSLRFRLIGAGPNQQIVTARMNACPDTNRQ